LNFVITGKISNYFLDLGLALPLALFVEQGRPAGWVQPPREFLPPLRPSLHGRPALFPHLFLLFSNAIYI
jgi:hypothetical protein